MGTYKAVSSQSDVCKSTILIVDNLYTSISTDLDLTNNNDIAKVLKIIDAIQKEYNLTIILITHHLKHRAELIITKDDILGVHHLPDTHPMFFR